MLRLKFVGITLAVLLSLQVGTANAQTMYESVLVGSYLRHSNVGLAIQLVSNPLNLILYEDMFVMQSVSSLQNASHQSMGNSFNPGGSMSFEEPSDLPDWDFSFGFGGGYYESDYNANGAAIRFESETTYGWLFMSMRNDNVFMRSQLTYASTDGSGLFSAFDSNYYGLMLQPGYQLLHQDTHLVDVEVSGLFELGYTDIDRRDDQWRFSPGIGIDVSRDTPIGKISTGYNFLNSRNIDGDIEVTGHNYINAHNLYTAYLFPVVEDVQGTIAVQYSWIDDVPTTHEDHWLALEGKVNAKLSDKLTMVGSYSHNIAGGDGYGFSLSLAYLW
ncbi:MAG: hypothetical protein JKX85_14705 [Phycisphaeraceae bacterium]|nr:hypothetical protein [Phycisphaeraceae bacterium]